MKSKSILILLLLMGKLVFAREDPADSLRLITDSLRTIINEQKGDTAEVDALTYLANQQVQPDSGIEYAQQGLLLAEKIGYRSGKADCLFIIGNENINRGNFGPGIQYALDALSIYKDIADNVGMATVNLILQGTYRDAGDYKKALAYAFAGEQIAEAKKVKGKFGFPGMFLAPLFLAEIAQTYVLMNQLDSASFYTQESIKQKKIYHGTDWNFPVYLLATIQTMQGIYDQALKNYHLSVSLAIQNGVERDVLQNFSGMSTLFKKTGQFDSAIYYARLVVQSTIPDLEAKNLMESLSNLAGIYRLTGNKDSAIKYMALSYTLKDSIFNREKDREIQSLTFKEQLKHQEMAAAQAKFKTRVQLYSLAAGLFVSMLLAALLWRNNRHKQKANTQIEKAYADLKSTQAQLIQQEKMASLGELTAGIAHEIQNPLNFVNNFSEVNKELIEEVKNQKSKLKTEELDELLNNIATNEEKINHHGKRADSIVKNMLQHSRKSEGRKELTDINALCDEYLRLSYHGMRAKDKSFNADIKTDFDATIEKISIIPQDIGRVLLNLFNNAFYAVNERSKAEGERQKALSPAPSTLSLKYEPTVSVQTKKLNDKVEIKVIDNGNGIPQNIVDKIFQPFFTTKPTGLGTGLGLSLSYDIIKAHGGKIKVETKEARPGEPVGQGEGTTFFIHINS